MKTIERPANIDLAKTQITQDIRVSSAALYREEYFGSYWMVETWIFSDDPRQQSHQIIHGDPSVWSSLGLENTCAIARKVHAYVAANLMAKYGTSHEK